MVDSDFETHLQNLFEAPAALDDTEAFAQLIERDVRRMRLTMLWASGVVAAGLAAGVYFAFDPLWGRLSSQVWVLASQVRAATPHYTLLAQGAATLVAAAAAMVGLAGSRRILR